ncbi:MAG TPA: TonB family protein [Sandaracinaceae bacterium]
MLYCQQCGAGNSDDARFCNQCGAKIASAGEPGGPLASAGAPPSETTLKGHGRPVVTGEPRAHREEPAAGRSSSAPHEPPPPQSFDISTVSLSAIGVRSRGKAWGILVGTALLLMGLGALGTWVLMRTGAPGDSPAQADPAPPDPLPPEEIEIGDPLPEGAEPPDDVITGSPRPREGSARAPAKRTSSASAGSSPSRRGEAGGASGASGSGGSRASSGASGSPGASGSSGSASSSGTGGSRSTEPPDTIPDEPDWEAMEEADFEMEEYAMRVRSFVRQYYAQRAQSCFDHETRNVQSVRGTVVIGFDIQADGNVSNAEVVRNSTGLDTLGRCLASQVARWRLPPPPEAPLPMQIPFSR